MSQDNKFIWECVLIFGGIYTALRILLKTLWKELWNPRNQVFRKSVILNNQTASPLARIKFQAALIFMLEDH